MFFAISCNPSQSIKCAHDTRHARLAPNTMQLLPTNQASAVVTKSSCAQHDSGMAHADLLNGFSVHVVGDLQLRQVGQLAPVTQHDLHVAPHGAGPTAAVPATTQLTPTPAANALCHSV